MPDLIEQLRKSTTAAEVAALIPVSEQERVASQRRLDLLEDSREPAILDGNVARQNLRKTTEAEKDALDDWDAASRVAECRLKDFQKAEFQADMTAKKREAIEANAKLREKYLEIYDQLTTLAARLGEAGELTKTVERFNQVCKAGRADAHLVAPVLAQLMSANQKLLMPISGFPIFRSPLQWELERYWPRPHPVQPLALLKDLELR